MVLYEEVSTTPPVPLQEHDVAVRFGGGDGEGGPGNWRS